MKKISINLLFILMLILSPELGLAQGGELDTQKKIFHRNEKTFSFNLNSNGWGMNYRFGKRIDRSKQWIYNGDFNVMNHKKEFKNSSSSLAGGRYVYGKDNYVFNLQGSIGRQKEFFRKLDKGSISFRGYYIAGPTLAVMKPMYYKKQTGNNSITIQRYDKSLQPAYIAGRASFFRGVSETTALPGVYAKAGFSFEYSKYDLKVRALEVGIALNIYPKKVIIMAEAPNSQIFPTVFVAFRFGKAVSGHNYDETKVNNGTSTQ